MEAIKAMHVPIYFECYDMHNDMKRVPKEFMNSMRKNKVGFWVDRRKSVVLLGHGFLVWSLVSFAMGFSVWSRGLEWSKSKREMENERIQGVERDIWVRFVSLEFLFLFFFTLSFFVFNFFSLN